jgi:predicted hotdog family 3-hydroxylacyl-ACP dehydratase
MLSAPLGRPDIAALIPHAGAMCLLDSIRFFNETTIVCAASSHRDPANPLASHGHLATICGVEYAAQTMAVHAGLTAAGRRPDAGYLASLRDVVCHAPRLDTLPEDLEITATRLGGDSAAALYEFAIRHAQIPILPGRAAVVVDARPHDRHGV